MWLMQRTTLKQTLLPCEKLTALEEHVSAILASRSLGTRGVLTGLTTALDRFAANYADQ
jgi:hypothetical protein